MVWTFILVPLVGALIGWFTNFIAVKMLFHPREPKKILFLTFQGIFPKRQRDIADKLGTIVAEELLSFEDLKSRINKPQNIQQIEKLIDKKLEAYLVNDFPKEYPLLAILMGPYQREKIRESVVGKVGKMGPEMIDNYLDKLESSIDIKQMVSDKVASFSPVKLEDMLNAVLQKEFGFIERIGALLGFFIGLVQVLIIYFTS